MSPDAVTVAIIGLAGILVTAIIAPLIILSINRGKDGTALAQNALTVANQAVADLKNAQAEIRALKDAKTGPFHIHLVISVDPLEVKAEIVQEKAKQ